MIGAAERPPAPHRPLRIQLEDEVVVGRLELLEVVGEAHVADVVVIDLRDARLVQVCVDGLAAEDRRGAAELRSDLMGERMGVDDRG